MKRMLPSLWGKLQKKRQTTFLPRGEAQESSQEQGVLELGCYTGEPPSALILGQLLPNRPTVQGCCSGALPQSGRGDLKVYQEQGQQGRSLASMRLGNPLRALTTC